MPRTLTDRLGLKSGMRLHLIGLPYPIDGLLADEGSPADLVLGFAPDAGSVAPVFAAARAALAPGGRLWLAYPKLTGGIATDITRDRGWDALAAADWLPVAQVAVDETWSALRFRPRGEIPKLTRQF